MKNKNLFRVLLPIILVFFAAVALIFTFGVPGPIPGNFTPPACVDYEKNGLKYIVTIDNGNKQLCIFNHTGEMEKYIKLAEDMLYSPPAVGDIDNDGTEEVVFIGYQNLLDMQDENAKVEFGKGKCFIYNKSTEELSEGLLGISGCIIINGKSKEVNPPVLYDIGNDGKLGIIFAYAKLDVTKPYDSISEIKSTANYRVGVCGFGYADNGKSTTSKIYYSPWKKISELDKEASVVSNLAVGELLSGTTLTTEEGSPAVSFDGIGVAWVVNGAKLYLITYYYEDNEDTYNYNNQIQDFNINYGWGIVDGFPKDALDINNKHRMSGPTLCDFDDDGGDEVIVADFGVDNKSVIRIFDNTGNEIFTHKHPDIPGNYEPAQSPPPILGNFKGDEGLDIIVPLKWHDNVQGESFLDMVIVNKESGAEFAAYPQLKDVKKTLILSQPICADILGDDTTELVFEKYNVAGTDFNLPQGEEGEEFNTGMIANLDNDTNPEIVLTSDKGIYIQEIDVQGEVKDDDRISWPTLYCNNQRTNRYNKEDHEKGAHVPVIVSQEYSGVYPLTISEGEIVSYQIEAFDPNPYDFLNYKLLSCKKGSEDIDLSTFLNPVTSLFSWPTKNGDGGYYYLVFSVTDTNGDTDDGHVKIKINCPPTNCSIKIKPPPANMPENGFTKYDYVKIYLGSQSLDTGKPTYAKIWEEGGETSDWIDYKNYSPGGLAWILSKGDGLKTVHAKFKNSYGESTEVYDSIELDTTDPVIEITSPSQQSKIFLKEPKVTIKGSCSDKNLDPSSPQLTVPPNVQYIISKSGAEFSIDVSLPGEGDYAVEITAKDKANRTCKKSIYLNYTIPKPNLACTNYVNIKKTTTITFITKKYPVWNPKKGKVGFIYKKLAVPITKYFIETKLKNTGDAPAQTPLDTNIKATCKIYELGGGIPLDTIEIDIPNFAAKEEKLVSFPIKTVGQYKKLHHCKITVDSNNVIDELSENDNISLPLYPQKID